MKTRVIYFLTAVLAVFGSTEARGQISNTNVYNPAGGSRRNPVSSYQPGLVPNRAEGVSGNDIITGNVGGGKHFRGFLPYQSTTAFSGPLTSTSLDSFRRLTVDPDYSNAPGSYEPFYSRTGSVTTTTPGGMIYKPGIDYLPGQKPAEIAVPDREEVYAESARRRRQEQLRAQQEPRLNIQDVTNLIPVTAGQLRRQEGVLNQAEQFSALNDLTPAQRRAQIEQIIRDLGLEEKAKPETRERGVEQPEPFIRDDARDQIEPFSRKDIKEPVEAFGKERPGPEEYQMPKEQLDSMEKPDQLDLYKQIKSEDYQQVEPDAGAEKPRSGTDELMQKLEELKQSVKPKRGPLDAQRGVTEDAEAVLEKMPSGSDLESQAKHILGQHKDFESYAEDRYNSHLLYGSEMLKTGKYYQAAEAFGMAMVYNPQSWLAMAGRGHSLFGAGEYMTGAMFISMALESYPAFAGAKLSVEAMIGERDTLDARMAEIEQLLQKVDVAELHFLKGYYYYRTGRFNEAAKSIDKVLASEPDLRAAKILKEAINQAAN